MIAVIIPAHNEEMSLSRCLAAATLASRHAHLQEEVQIILVLDSCTDRSQAIAEEFPHVSTLTSHARNVGAARASGADCALQRGARWLAFTDADSVVHEDWLVQQLACEADAVCGTVYVLDWSQHCPKIRERYDAHYNDCDGHRHIHGANLGISHDAYKAIGGFVPLATGEDVALVKSLEDLGRTIKWSARPRVATSARLDARCTGGFSDFVKGLLEPEAHHTKIPG